MRAIPGTDLRATQGGYPLFVFDGVDGLRKDFARMGEAGLVSLGGAPTWHTTATSSDGSVSGWPCWKTRTLPRHPADNRTGAHPWAET